MKKSLVTLITLVLIFACLATSCTFTPVDESKIPMMDYQTTTAGTTGKQETTTAPVEPSDPVAIIGKWSSSTVPMVFQFFSDGTLKCFYLAPGYYEYSAIYTGTYTYDGLTLTYQLDDDSNFNGSCSVANNVMTINSQHVFKTATELPTLHAKYTFPDYEALAAKYPLADGTYTGNTIPTTLRAEALANLEETYWQNQSTANWAKLTTGTAKLGDYVNIDYCGKLNGVAFSGGTAQNQIIEVNDGTGMIDGFCIGVAGHTVGETFDVPVTFPEDYHSADLAGKEAVFTMTLNCIYDFSLTDEIAVANKYESLEAWVNSEYDLMLADKVWDLIPGLKDNEIPEEAYLFFYQYYLDSLYYNAFYYFGNNLDQCLAYFGVTLEGLHEDSIAIGKQYLRSAQVAAKLNLVPDEALIEKVTSEMIEAYTSNGYTEAQAKELLENEGKTEFRAELLFYLVSDYLIENNTFTNEQ